MKLFFTPPLPIMKKQKQTGLGDICAAIYILENWGKAKKKEHEVCGNILFKKIIELTDIRHVFWTEDISGSIKVSDSFSKPNEHWIVAFKKIIKKRGFSESCCGCLSSKLKPNKKFNNYSLIQFDGRLLKSRGITIENKQIENIVNKFCKQKIGIIGGPDTDFYFGHQYEYFLGNLDYIIECLLGCQCFVGCDSGISHLASMYGVKSHVFVMNPEFEDIKNFYKIYNNTECHNYNIKLI